MGKVYDLPLETKKYMIDYISVIKYLDKDSPFLGYCIKSAVYSTGWLQYSLEGCEKLKVFWNPQERLLRVNGSVMYFWQGHNFTCAKDDFEQAVDYLQRILKVGLWDAEIEAFEFGAIMQVDQRAKCYVQNHHVASGVKLVQNEKGKDHGSFRWWESPSLKLKMYDARKNILLKQGVHRRKVIEEAGWDPKGNYLKFEIHFLKPELINGGRVVHLEQLLHPSFYAKLKTILVEQYQMLMPMKTMRVPTIKKDLTSADILLLAYVESFINAEGQTPAAALKALNKRVNMIPNEILSKSDKDSRKRQFKMLFAKLSDAQESQWDVGAKLQEALAADWKEN